jgi:hypothetical protein
MKKRVSKLEKRINNLESRMGRTAAKGSKSQPPAKGASTKGAKAPPSSGKGAKAGATSAKDGNAPNGEAPTPVILTLTGDAKAVVLSNGKRRFKVPGRAPAGKMVVLAAFGEDELAKKNEITLPKAETATLHCTVAADGCTVE